MASTQSQVQQLLVIDTRVQKWQNLTADLAGNVAVLVLDANQDGVAQINAYVQQLTEPLQSIHVLSHGGPGSLSIGSTVLSSQNIDTYSQQLANIGSHLTYSGDILLYGCDVAQGEVGARFVDRLAQLSGADVAASSNLTGAAALGGDWQLEQRVGMIEAGQIFGAETMQAYDGLLNASLKKDNVKTLLGSFLNNAIVQALPGYDGIKSAVDAAIGKVDEVGFDVKDKLGHTEVTIHGVNDLTLIVDPDISSGASQLLAVDYVAKIPVLDILQNAVLTTFIPTDLLPTTAEFIVSNQPFTFVNDLKVDKGVTLITSIDLQSYKGLNPFLLLEQALKVNTINVIANASASGQSFSAVANYGAGGKGYELFKVNVPDSDDFSVTVNNFSLSASLSNGSAEATASQTYTYRGIDPSQYDEPDLVVSSGIKIDGDTIIGYGQVQTASLDNWKNPFGIAGKFSALAFEVGFGPGSAVPVEIGLVADLKSSSDDFRLFVNVATDDPDNNAFALTVNQPKNLVQLLAQFAAGPLLPAQALISAASPLFNYIPMTVVSVDSDGDHILDPLFKFAPTTTSVGTIELAAGFAINAQVDVGGQKGTLIFDADTAFKTMSGSLVIQNLKLGSVLSIGGTQPGTDLTASFSINTISNDARFNGDGKIALFGMTLTKGRFEVVHTSEIDSVSITNAEINLGLFALKIDQFSLKLDGTQSHALGNGSLDILGQQAATASFDISKEHIKFRADVKLGELLHMNGNFDWSGSTNVIDAAGTLTINGTQIASATFHSDAAGNATLTGSISVPLGGIFNKNVSAAVTVHYKSSGAISIDIDANLGTLGHVKPSLKIEEFNLNKLGTAILHDANELVGNISEVAQKAIDAGITTIDAFATHTFTKDDFDSISGALVNLGGEIGDIFSGGGKRSARKFASDADNTPTSGDPLKSSGQNDILYGNGGNDIVYGGSGKDYIDGGTGNDYLNGETGNDTIYGGTGNDTILGGTGNDQLYGGAGDDLIEDFSGNNNLYGDAGNDTLNGAGHLYGGTGDDRLVSGAGSDVLVGNSGNDLAFGGGGNDFLEGDEGDDALHGEAGNDTIYGGSGNDGMTGGDGNDSLYGEEGNDTLVGGEGADYMEGDQGDDTYYVQSPFDEVKEQANEGTDTVSCSGNYQLVANVENLTLTGNANDYGGGNELNNLIIGSAANNTLEGRAGNDTLDGGAGIDHLIGGTGNDTYYVDYPLDRISGEGDSKTEIDNVYSSVFWALGLNLENLVLTGTAAIDGSGNSLNNILTGNAAKNTLDGDGGNDIYIVQNTDDVVVETSTLTTEIDGVFSSVDYTLPANVENLNLTGTHAINGTGNKQDNTITGNAGANNLDGGAGADTLIGGAGNDTYIVDNTSDQVTENANEGTDTVLISATFSLSANVENLTLTGSAAINATGNALNNVLTGNDAINTLSGGAGDDTYIVQNAEDTVVENAKEGIDTVLSSVTDTLSANVENLTLTGTAAINGTGNELNNTLTGNVASNYLTGGAGSDVLDGGAGADTLEGNAGNDWYIVDNIGDKVIEVKGGGIDTVFSSVNYSLSDEVENLTLSGVSYAAKTVYSITNNDYLEIKTLIATKQSTRWWDKATVDAIKGGAKYADFGTTTPAHFEGALAGGGNALNNTLTGNDGDNNLIGGAGNDYLDGGTGADSLDGGAGSDVYVVDNVNDVIIESGTGLSDFDTVRSSITYTLIANIERLELTGTAALNGTGNAAPNVVTGNTGANTLMGLGGNDVLDGGGGADTLIGGTGDDMLDGGDGNDMLDGGDGNDNLSGGNGVDRLNGADGNDRLDGGAGADVLFGGAGKDTFVTTLSPIFGLSDVDTYADFTVADDKIELGTVGYNGLPYTHAATFAAGEFIAGAGFTAAKDADDRIIYDTTTGALYFDRDGNGVNVAIKFAVVLVGTALTADNFTFA